jgi:hypothetical protein
LFIITIYLNKSLKTDFLEYGRIGEELGAFNWICLLILRDQWIGGLRGFQEGFSGVRYNADHVTLIRGPKKIRQKGSFQIEEVVFVRAMFHAGDGLAGGLCIRE